MRVKGKIRRRYYLFHFLIDLFPSKVGVVLFIYALIYLVTESIRVPSRRKA